MDIKESFLAWNRMEFSIKLHHSPSAQFAALSGVVVDIILSQNGGAFTTNARCQPKRTKLFYLCHGAIVARRAAKDKRAKGRRMKDS